MQNFIKERLKQRFWGQVFGTICAKKLVLICQDADLSEVASFLKNDQDLQFEHLANMAVFDIDPNNFVIGDIAWNTLPQSYQHSKVALYQLSSLFYKQEITLITPLAPEMPLPTLAAIWPAASWPEKMAANLAESSQPDDLLLTPEEHNLPWPCTMRLSCHGAKATNLNLQFNSENHQVTNKIINSSIKQVLPVLNELDLPTAFEAETAFLLLWENALG